MPVTKDDEFVIFVAFVISVWESSGQKCGWQPAARSWQLMQEQQ
jgi:hypothetical protein